MTLKSQRSIAVLIVVILGICLFGSGIVAAQSNSPAPTPAPGGENLPSQAPGEDSVLPLGKTDKDDRRLIANGKSLTGKINPSTDEDTYIFYATEGQQVTIKMTAKSSSLDGYLKLYTARMSSCGHTMMIVAVIAIRCSICTRYHDQENI